MSVRSIQRELPARCCVPIAAPRLGEAEAEATADVFKALADPHRVRIVNLLANSDEPVCVCDITDVIGLSQPTVSFHLKKLVDSGLIQREQRGTWGFYSLDSEAMDSVSAVVNLGGKR
jgi:ArsR family transcriptional regulator, arsenate/arsenite/antimonite-responsive transcriptional repressor